MQNWYFILWILFIFTSFNASADSVVTDSRIKIFVYNDYEVFQLNFHYGYQAHIDFAKGESVTSISVGDSSSWYIYPHGSRIFIKPYAENLSTNMTVITNKRVYEFDISAKSNDDIINRGLTYVVKFYYPEDSHSPLIQSKLETTTILEAIVKDNNVYEEVDLSTTTDRQIIDHGGLVDPKNSEQIIDHGGLVDPQNSEQMIELSTEDPNDIPARKDKKLFSDYRGSSNDSYDVTIKEKNVISDTVAVSNPKILANKLERSNITDRNSETVSQEYEVANRLKRDSFVNVSNNRVVENVNKVDNYSKYSTTAATSNIINETAQVEKKPNDFSYVAFSKYKKILPINIFDREDFIYMNFAPGIRHIQVKKQSHYVKVFKKGDYFLIYKIETPFYIHVGQQTIKIEKQVTQK